VDGRAPMSMPGIRALQTMGYATFVPIRRGSELDRQRDHSAVARRRHEPQLRAGEPEVRGNCRAARRWRSAPCSRPSAAATQWCSPWPVAEVLGRGPGHVEAVAVGMPVGVPVGRGEAQPHQLPPVQRHTEQLQVPRWPPGRSSAPARRSAAARRPRRAAAMGSARSRASWSGLAQQGVDAQRDHAGYRSGVRPGTGR